MNRQVIFQIRFLSLHPRRGKSFLHQVSVSRGCWSRVQMSGVLRAPRTPCGRARPAPASDGVAVLARVDDGVRRHITASAFFTVGNNKNASFLSDATPFARLRAAVFRKDRFPPPTVCAVIYGRFCGTFFAAPARFFTSAQVFAPSRPAKGCAPFDPRQGAPCTCPASPFMAKPGLCFTYRACNRKTAALLLFYAFLVFPLFT